MYIYILNIYIYIIYIYIFIIHTYLIICLNWIGRNHLSPQAQSPVEAHGPLGPGVRKIEVRVVGPRIFGRPQLGSMMGKVGKSSMKKNTKIYWSLEFINGNLIDFVISWTLRVDVVLW